MPSPNAFSVRDSEDSNHPHSSATSSAGSDGSPDRVISQIDDAKFDRIKEHNRNNPRFKEAYAKLFQNFGTDGYAKHHVKTLYKKVLIKNASKVAKF